MKPADQLRSYGRRKSHRLSPYREGLFETLLPKLRLDPGAPRVASLDELFAGPMDDYWLEIGFGNGEHLVAQAERHPEIGMIGCEPFINGVATLLAEIDQKGLKNIRIFDDDVRLLLDWLPEGEIGRAFILFPDPWPKKRHHKRRLVSKATLDQLARVMRVGACLRLASDIGDYVRSSLAALMRHRSFFWRDEGPADWRVRGADWPQTRYEQKAIEAGRKPVYLSFERVGGTKR